MPAEPPIRLEAAVGAPLPLRVVRAIPTGTRVGLGCLALSITPLLAGVTLDALELIDVGNALGLGLWLAFTAPIALLVLLVGAIADFRQRAR